MNDYEEMLLHHLATVQLYVSFIIGNWMHYGVLIAYLHDLADLVGSLSKLLNALVFQDTSAVVFVCVMIVWFQTRIVTFSQIIYFIFTSLTMPAGME